MTIHVVVPKHVATPTPLTVTKAGTLHVAAGATVIVQPPNDQIMDNFTIGLCIGTFLLAFATGVLAWKTWQLHAATKELAEDTVAGAALADKHHQEAMGAVLSLQYGKVTENGPLLFFQFVIRNTGGGTATSVEATLEVVLDDESIYRKDYIVVGPLGSNDSYVMNVNPVEDAVVVESKHRLVQRLDVDVKFRTLFGVSGECKGTIAKDGLRLTSYSLPHAVERELPSGKVNREANSDRPH